MEKGSSEREEEQRERGYNKKEGEEVQEKVLKIQQIDYKKWKLRPRTSWDSHLCCFPDFTRKIMGNLEDYPLFI
jgi:hypothetical protein